MTINIADNSPRISYSVASGVTQTSFAVPFEFFSNTDLQVYVDGVLMTLGSDYTTTGGSGATGSISMSVTGASGGSTVVITRSVPIERTSDFPTSGPFQITALNTELDRLIAIAADIEDAASRGVKLSDFDTSVSLTLPLASVRANKVLAFDATGEMQVTNEIGNYNGNWTSGFSYSVRDLVKDTSTNNVYICLVAHTSSGVQPITTNADAAKWALLVDAAAATTSANNAASSASAAASSAADALVSENNAAASESAAATSETNAATSAAAALVSENNAESSQSSAASSQTAAAASATAAAASQSAAATSATSASNSAATATSEAAAAATSETNAAASATAAASSATSASSSATSASNSASSASTSATAAASSASAAATSATNAATSETNAAASAALSANAAIIFAIALG